MTRMSAWWVVIIISIVICISKETIGSQVKGVAPEEEAAYLAEFYQCPESKEIIPKSSINDDFCDCKDGSDEPGTSACSHLPSRGFFCRNKGHKSKYIFTSQVNDGICDCCDGSDEYFGFGQKCGNKCLEQGKEEIVEMKEEIKRHREGAEKRREYIVKAQNAKPLLFDSIRQLEEKLAVKQREHDEHKAKEDAARAINNEAKEILDDKSEDLIREDEESDDEEKEARRNDEEFQQKRLEFTAKHNISPEDAQKHYTELKAATRKIKNELEDIENDLKSKNAIAKTDFGEHSEYFALTEETIEYNTNEYRYAFHPFSKMLQGSTELGNWEGWNNGYSEMLYKHGRKCWGAGERETSVFLHCGPQNEIRDVSEPSTCVYHVQFYTPLACSESYAKELEERIHDLLGLEITVDL